MKRADVTAIFKKGNDNGKENYPSEVCSQLFQNCLKNYYLSKVMIICKVNSQSMLQVFGKTTSLSALLVMIEKWKAILNKKLKVGALFMDL